MGDIGTFCENWENRAQLTLCDVSRWRMRILMRIQNIMGIIQILPIHKSSWRRFRKHSLLVTEVGKRCHPCDQSPSRLTSSHHRSLSHKRMHCSCRFIIDNTSQKALLVRLAVFYIFWQTNNGSETWKLLTTTIIKPCCIFGPQVESVDGCCWSITLSSHPITPVGVDSTSKERVTRKITAKSLYFLEKVKTMSHCHANSCINSSI